MEELQTPVRTVDAHVTTSINDKIVRRHMPAEFKMSRARYITCSV